MASPFTVHRAQSVQTRLADPARALVTSKQTVSVRRVMPTFAVVSARYLVRLWFGCGSPLPQHPGRHDVATAGAFPARSADVSSPAHDATILRRTSVEIWELVAREHIRDTLARYNWSGDAGRLGELAETFCADGVLEIRGFEPLRGRSEIVSFLGVVTGDIALRA